MIFQPDFDDPRYCGINPYALGFAMMQDIKRICVEPTDEDREWFPDIAGRRRLARRAARRLGQLPRRKLRAAVPLPAAHPRVPAVRALRQGGGADRTRSTRSTTPRATGACAPRSPTATTSRANEPDIQVVDVDLLGDRPLVLRHTDAQRRRPAEAGP